MIVRLVQNAVDDFSNYLNTKARLTDESLLFWESLYHYKQNWDLHTDDISVRIDKAFYNSQSKRFWEQSKKILLLFAKQDATMLAMMFRDLYNEEKSLSGRIDRFKFYSDHLLETLLLTNLKLENNHFQTTEMVYYYLSLNYPEKYCPYVHKDFIKTMEMLEIKDVPLVYDPERFFKISRILNKYLFENQAVQEGIEKLLKGSIFYKNENMLRVTYFCAYCANHSSSK